MRYLQVFLGGHETKAEFAVAAQAKSPNYLATVSQVVPASRRDDLGGRIRQVLTLTK